MKRIILVLLPLLIACSFQVKESEGEDERLSRRPVVEGKDVYSQFDLDTGFTPYYEERVPRVDYQTDDRERVSRSLSLEFFGSNEKLSETDKYDPYNIYQKDQLDYEVESIEDILEIESQEEELKIKTED